MFLKSYFFSLMTDKRNNLPDAMVKSVLWVISWVYMAAVKAVDVAYKLGIRRRHRVEVPVISIGNLTLGGTGKTPFAIFLAGLLVREGKRPAILMRGYGADENIMVNEKLGNVPVFTGQDRVSSARTAIRQGVDTIILDDGFQHRRISRELDILLLDAGTLFGNGHIFPRGILREPISSIKRADMVVLTKTDRIDKSGEDALTAKLRRYMPGGALIYARHKPVSLRDVSGAKFPVSCIKNVKILAVSGIADPGYFIFLIEREGASIVKRLDYPDHYDFKQKDIDGLAEEVEKIGVDKVIVTEKDYVKIKKLDISGITKKLFVFNVDIEIVKGEEHLINGLNRVSACKSA